jgi:phosphatidylinositol glycan class B
MQYSTVLALVIRVTIALATRTFFQPDEYFQALEPAHYLVFGYGDLTWEWTSKPPIRTILYPALNIPIYWLLKIFSLDGTSLLVRWSFLVLTRSIHSWVKDCSTEGFTWPDGRWDRYMDSGAFSEDAWPELCACHCKCVLPTRSPNLIRDVVQLFLSLTSFFHALSLSRSMSNSLETTLTTIALCYYPWDTSVPPSR